MQAEFEVQGGFLIDSNPGERCCEMGVAGGIVRGGSVSIVFHTLEMNQNGDLVSGL